MGLLHNSVLFCFLYLLLGYGASSAAYLPLPPSVQCNGTEGCTIQNYQGIWGDRMPCRAARAFFPTSESELFDAVAMASRTGSKVKVIGSSHSWGKLVCPGGFVIGTHNLKSILHVNLSSLTVTVQAGIQLDDLVTGIAAHRLALPHSPLWHDISAAGMLSAGAHGSGLWHRGSSVHDYVVGMRLIVPADEEEGFAKIVDLSQDDEDLKAAKLSLGVMGAISQVTFQAEPMFKRSASFDIQDESHLDGTGILQFAKDHEFGEICWYPFSGKALFKVSNRVDVNTIGDGAYRMAVIDRLDVEFIESMRHTLKAAETSQSFAELCEEETRVMTSRVTSGDGHVNSGNVFTGYPVIGLNHRMQTSGGCENGDTMLPVITPTGIDFNPSYQQYECSGDNFIKEGVNKVLKAAAADDKLETCLWNIKIDSLLVFDTEIAIPTSKVADAITELERLRDMNPEPMCGLTYIGGVWMRFVTASDAYLGGSTNSVVFGLLYYRARDPFTPRMHEDFFEEIEQMLINKFGGRPHWGKNLNWAFGDMQARTRDLP